MVLILCVVFISFISFLQGGSDHLSDETVQMMGFKQLLQKAG